MCQDGSDLKVKRRTKVSLADLQLPRIHRFKSVSLYCDPDSCEWRASIIAAYHESADAEWDIELLLSGVSRFQVPGFGCKGSFEFVDLYIEDVRTHQMEGISYWFRDHEVHDTAIACTDYDFYRVEPVFEDDEPN